MDPSISDDDLTSAYLLGAERMRDKLHKQADEIECLRDENKILRYKLELLLQAAYSEEYTTSFFRVSAMRDILGTGNE